MPTRVAQDHEDCERAGGYPNLRDKHLCIDLGAGRAHPLEQRSLRLCRQAAEDAREDVEPAPGLVRAPVGGRVAGLHFYCSAICKFEVDEAKKKMAHRSEALVSVLLAHSFGLEEGAHLNAEIPLARGVVAFFARVLVRLHQLPAAERQQIARIFEVSDTETRTGLVRLAGKLTSAVFSTDLKHSEAFPED